MTERNGHSICNLVCLSKVVCSYSFPITVNAITRFTLHLQSFLQCPLEQEDTWHKGHLRLQ
jgi:hypothetical protein